MKFTVTMALLLSAYAQGQQGTKPAYRVAATHDSLAPIAAKASTASPVTKFEPATGPDATVTKVPGNLIDQSDVISFGGMTTLIPKLAIIRLPEEFKNRVNNHTPGNRILTWIDFFAANQGWIRTVEVTQSQAAGREPFASETAESYSKGHHLVIATFRGGPVSMLPPKIETPAPTAKNEPTRPQ